MADLNALHGTITAGHSGSWPGQSDPSSPSNVIDGNDATKSSRASNASGGGVGNWWQSDLGAPYIVGQMVVYWPTDGSNWEHGGRITVQGSSDGSTWHVIAQTETTGSYVSGITTFPTAIYTFAANETYRYWRLWWEENTPGLRFNIELALNAWTIADATIAPVAAFGGGPTAIVHEFQFDDESLNAPTSWAWTFGDGGTSTAQDPSHVYAAAGTYSVGLTVMNAAGSDTVTRDIAIIDALPYDPPEPGLAILEIYVSDPGAPRWGLANWGEAFWGSSGWVDVTPQGVTCTIQWGVTRPELGILAVPEAAIWRVTFYDPDRILDPANPDSPYASDLRPGLPIRIRHRGVTVRTGQADQIGHSMGDDSGLIRGSDIISRMARADVPEDAILADTLIARVQDAIAAAGLAIDVDAGGFGPDVALGAQLTGAHTVWEHVRDGAQAVLVQPWVTRDGRLAFRPYGAPLSRDRLVSSPNLVDLLSLVDTAGLVSEVHVQQTVADGGLLIDRAVTPPPWFGKRIVTRAAETPDAEAWADAVLADRAVTGIRWVPGEIYPLTADEVEYFATIEGAELVGLRMLEATPDIDAGALVLGGTISAFPKAGSTAQWRFTYEAAASASVTGLTPLTLDGGGPNDYLTTESGSDYLYEG